MNKITIIREEENEGWFAFADDNETIFGRGNTPDEALRNLASDIYHRLK